MYPALAIVQRLQRQADPQVTAVVSCSSGSASISVVHGKEKSAQSNWWMMWRRAAGGIPAEEQQRLFDAALPQLKRSVAELVEGTRLLGSLERVESSRKAELVAGARPRRGRGRV